MPAFFQVLADRAFLCAEREPIAGGWSEMSTPIRRPNDDWPNEVECPGEDPGELLFPTSARQHPTESDPPGVRLVGKWPWAQQSEAGLGGRRSVLEP